MALSSCRVINGAYYISGWSGYKTDFSGYVGRNSTNGDFAVAVKVSVPAYNGTPQSINVTASVTPGSPYSNGYCNVYITSSDPTSGGATPSSNIGVSEKNEFSYSAPLQATVSASSVLSGGSYYIVISPCGINGYGTVNMSDIDVTLSFAQTPDIASTITVTPFVTLGNTMNIDITSTAGTSYKHSLAYAIMSASDAANESIMKNKEYTALASNVSSGYTWTPPVEFSLSITNSATAVCVIRCTTMFQDGTLVGSPYYCTDCTLTVPSDEQITIRSVTVTKRTYSSSASTESRRTYENNLLNSGDLSSMYIQGYSSADIVVTTDTSSAYGATLKDCTITCDDMTCTKDTADGLQAHSNTIYNSGVVNISAVTTDSRGRTSTYNTSISVTAYEPPKLKDVVCYRSNTSGKQSTNGSEIFVSATAVYSSCLKQNKIIAREDTSTDDVIFARYKITNGSWVTTPNTPYDSNSSQWAVLTSGAGRYLTNPNSTSDNISSAASYVVEFSITDLLNTTTVSKIVPTSSVTFHSQDGGMNFAVGKFAEVPDAFEIGFNRLILKTNSEIYGTKDIEGTSGDYEGQIYFKLME